MNLIRRFGRWWWDIRESKYIETDSPQFFGALLMRVGVALVVPQLLIGPLLVYIEGSWPVLPFAFVVVGAALGLIGLTLRTIGRWGDRVADKAAQNARRLRVTDELHSYLVELVRSEQLPFHVWRAMMLMMEQDSIELPPVPSHNHDERFVDTNCGLCQKKIKEVLSG